ncbi:uncharacterized protein LOC121798190 [Salvia splendens]|uniref:uncharacterized protein LOC121798190 n=1 Tax=Salvia splendens TaxID=180675 RepID=UPI001C257FDD|nr:uncharacterized protein LOC121798190 [Salvia splendens]XP_042053003.1 uncharacterized protein LOC121798190 [Salvia splendens]
MEPAKLDHKRGIQPINCNPIIHYKVINSPLDTSFYLAQTCMTSKNAFRSSNCVVSTVFRKNLDWYDIQNDFSSIKDSETLKYKLYDDLNEYALAEEISFNLHDFLLKKLLGTTWNRNEKHRATAHYHRGNDNSLWWDDIKDDFRTIFGPVIAGLRVIHWKKLYHGNILDGVAVKGKGDGVLFNMKNHPKLCLLQSQNLITHQIQDIRHLIQLMEWFFLYPFAGDAKLPQLVKECKVCLDQLSIGLSPRFGVMSIERNWSMRLPIIWNDRDVYCFMLFCFRLIFEDLNWHSYQCFFNDHNWIQRAQNCSQQLTTVLNYSPYSYRCPIHQLKFWRNCAVHMNVKGQRSNRSNHREIMRMSPGLLLDVVKTFNYIVGQSSLTGDGPSVTSLIEDMNWD